MRIFLDTSVLLAACRSKSGASRAVLDIAANKGWKLIASPWVRNEVEKNLSKFPFESTATWVGLRSRISLVDDVVSIDQALVFPATKDRPVLITALAWADVLGLRNLNRVTGHIQGVLIQPYDTTKPVKEVPPQNLRYNLRHDGFRLNDHQQLFVNAPKFNVLPDGNIREDAPIRPGSPLAPLTHGASAADKEMTLRIDKLIRADKSLSAYGRNVEVATLNGKTTIRGRTITQSHKSQILGYAVSVAGKGNVKDLIEVRPMSEAEKWIDR